MKNILFVTHAHILYGMPMADVNSASAQPSFYINGNHKKYKE